MLTGQDLLTGLQGRELGDELLLPSVMLRQGEPVFLDDMTLESLAAQLPVPIQIVHGAADVVDSVLGAVGKVPKLRESSLIAVRRITAGICLVAGVVSSGVPPALSEDAVQVESALIDQATLPDAIDSKGARPKADPSVISPAVDALPPPLLPLAAPPSLALPDAPSQVRIHELRPLTLEEALQLAEVNSPKLKAAASRVDQAKSALRAAIAAWYPTVDLSASGLPEYFKSYPTKSRLRSTPRKHQPRQQVRDHPTGRLWCSHNEFYGRDGQRQLQVSWDLINPPVAFLRLLQLEITFERAGDAYLIALRDLRLGGRRRPISTCRKLMKECALARTPSKHHW